MSARLRTALLAAGLLGLVMSPMPASAQGPSPSRFAVWVGPEWLGTMDQGGVDAMETGNGRAPVTLFRTESELAGGTGLAVGFAVRLTRTLWAETAVRYHSARLTIRTSEDSEGADATAREGLQQYRVEAGALWVPEEGRLGTRTQLFAVGGTGYLRQLHSRQLLAESGRSYTAGGGAILWLPGRQGGTFNAVGLRLEGRAVISTGGTAFDDRAHAAPSASASLFLRF